VAAAGGSGSGERGVEQAVAQSANLPMAHTASTRHTAAMLDAAAVDQLTDVQVRALVSQLLTDLRHKQATIDKLTHELAVLRRVRFGVKSEALSAGQRSLFEESVDEDLAALEERLAQLRAPAADRPRGQAKRLPLPPNLPRREICHEPASTVCTCGCALQRIGEDVAERLDYEPGRFQVERHVRGKWVCGACRTLVQAPVPPQVIDKVCPAPDCWPMCWWPSTPIIFPCIGKKPSMRGPGWRCRARRWRSGWGPAACSCSRWSMP
jgi:hypothetical protein